MYICSYIYIHAKMYTYLYKYMCIRICVCIYMIKPGCRIDLILRRCYVTGMEEKRSHTSRHRRLGGCVHELAAKAAQLAARIGSSTRTDSAMLVQASATRALSGPLVLVLPLARSARKLGPNSWLALGKGVLASPLRSSPPPCAWPSIVLAMLPYCMRGHGQADGSSSRRRCLNDWTSATQIV